MNTLISHLRQSLRRPDHWSYGSWLDTVIKYRRTRLGVAWLVIPTAVYIWGIGGFLASMQPGLDRARYFAHVGIGFAVFRFMTAVLVDASSVFSGYQSYIHDGHLRLTDFLLRNLARSFYYFLVSLPVVAVVVLASPDFAPSGLALSVFGIVVLVLNLLVYSTLLAMAGARFPDLSEIMGSVMMAAFLVTPIIWYSDAAHQETVPATIIQANPLHHLLELIRAPVLGESVAASTYVYLIVMTVVGVLASVAVYPRVAKRIPAWL